MAVWQFDFHLIKRDRASFYDETKPWGDGKNEVLMSWSSCEIDETATKRISAILVPCKSWAKHTIQFGKIDESCVEISTFEDGNCEIFIRLDIRNFSRELLDEVIFFIQKNDANIVYENKCYPADEETFLKLIRNSNAYKFCKSPKHYLTNLKTERNQ